MQGVFCLWIGILDPRSAVTLVGGIAGMAIFMDAANGAAYALVPHVNPQSVPFPVMKEYEEPRG